MHKKLAVMCSAMVTRKAQILLHNNGRPHVAQQTLENVTPHKFFRLGVITKH